MLRLHGTENKDKITGSFNSKMHASSSWLSVAISSPSAIFLACPSDVSACPSSKGAISTDKAATELLQIIALLLKESATFYLNTLDCLLYVCF